MNVPSYEFLGFAALVAIVLNVRWRAAPWRRAVLLVANLAFAATFAHDSVGLMPFGALLLAGFVSVKIAEVQKSKAVFVALLAVLIVAFCVLKQYTFVPRQAFLPFAYVTVGMSYVFFRVLHLVIDAFQDALPVRISALDYVNYTLNFTSLVSGPIQLFQDYHRQESEEPASLAASDAARALERIVTGFFKVAIVSPLLFALHARCVSGIASGSAGASRTIEAAGAIALFPIYLYFNFGGYTDFVIGAARFLRLRLPENFNRPFVAESFIDFWGRWHITLANWVKTYVYSPLLISLMRRFPSPAVEPLFGVLAYFVAFFFVGVWHGQTSMFVVLGILLGLGVSVNKHFQILMIRRLGRARYRALCARPAYAALSRGLTFTYFAVCSLWFWSSWRELGGLASGLGASGIVSVLVVLLVSSAVGCSVLKVAQDRYDAAGVSRAPAWPYARTAWITALVVVTVSVTVVLNAPAPHIVYRAF